MIRLIHSSVKDVSMNENYNASVLIVDDDPLSLSVITRALKGLCHLRVTKNPHEALTLMQASPPDLLLSDVNMPELDGYGLLEALQCHAETANIPTIFLTARTDQRDEERGLKLGAVDYVLKPINPSILRERVRLQLQLQLALKSESEARQRADELLEVILPTPAAQELRLQGQISPKGHSDVAVIFCDVVGFTAYCNQHDPDIVIQRLDRLFRKYEEIAIRYGVEKIKTIGDCFMATTGLLSEPSEGTRLSAAVLATLEMCAITPKITEGWSARAGVFVGPVVSGVVGDIRYQFDIWGDTVNVASRLCGVSAPHTLAVTQRDWRALSETGYSSRLDAKSLGLIALKGLQDTEIFELSLPL